MFNSYIDDVFSMSDSQAIASFNAPGPVRIINNFLEATGENIMFGGADPKIPNLVAERLRDPRRIISTRTRRG